MSGRELGVQDNLRDRRLLQGGRVPWRAVKDCFRGRRTDLKVEKYPGMEDYPQRWRASWGGPIGRSWYSWFSVLLPELEHSLASSQHDVGPPPPTPHSLTPSPTLPPLPPALPGLPHGGLREPESPGVG